MNSQKKAGNEIFLKGYTEYKRPAAKYAIVVPLVVFAAQWAYSTSDHFQSIPDLYKYTIWVIPVITFLVAAFIMVASSKCPVCKGKMKKLDPACDDYNTTYKYYCENCKVWVDRGKTNGTE